MGFLAAGVGIGLGIGVIRNLPAMTDTALEVVVVVWIVAMLAAWLGGRRFAQSQFQMQMQMQQQAQDQEQQQAQQQQVFVNVGGPGPHASGEGPALQVLSHKETLTLSGEGSSQRALAVDSDQGRSGVGELQRALEHVDATSFEPTENSVGELLAARKLYSDPLPVAKKLDVDDASDPNEWWLRVDG